jgi:hypothetical protein
MGMTESLSHPRGRDLEAHAAGESTPSSPSLVAHLPSCAVCRHRVAALAQDRERQLARLPAAVFVAQVARRREQHAARARRRNIAIVAIASGLGLATAAAAGLTIVPSVPDVTIGSTATDDVRMKGIGIQVFRKRGEQVAPLATGDRVRAGDGLRIAVTLAQPDRVSVWFVDRNGHIDRYPDEIPPTLAAGDTVLPGAVVVDAPCVDMRLIVQTSAGRLERALSCE